MSERLPSSTVLDGEPTTLRFVLPMRTIAVASDRESWRPKARRVAKERTITRLVCAPIFSPYVYAGLIPSLVTFTRLAPRDLDDDNLPYSSKAIRDEIAKMFGVGDSPRDPIRWAYAQRRSKTYAVEIVLEW